MARAIGSYPIGHGFKANSRYHGPLVKRLRHRPFTAVTGVRFSHGSPKKITSELFSSDVIFLSKPQAWYGINALAHCMESPKAYGITRKRVYASPCGSIPYATSSQFHTATSCGFLTRLRRDLDAEGERAGKEFVA